jgi:predicted unusual protein kinase regulating ubiquinone biosynthesis (AarF/ABC1/UbiB family)
MGEQKSIPSNRLSRFLEMSKLTTKIGLGYATMPLSFGKNFKEKIQETRHKNAMMIAETLGRLKGPILKVGQLVSTYDEFLPEEVIEALSTMQDSVPPLAYQVVRKAFKKEIGQDPEDVFSNFSKEPIAGASFGQVHKARLRDGRYVAVKIQYPDIDKVLDADMKNFRLWLSINDNKATHAFLGKGFSLNDVFAEIDKHIRMELDYINEAENIRTFRQMFEHDPDIQIPEVVHEFSTKRVLTMTFMNGHRLKDALSPELSVELRQKIGEKLLDMLFTQIVKYGIIHADPHPGNYLLSREDKIQLLDFGCVKRFSPTFHKNIVDIYRATYHNDKAAMYEACVAIGFVSSEKDFEKFYAATKNWLSTDEHTACKYNLTEFTLGFVITGMMVMRKARFDPEMVYYSRALAGVISYFNLLDVEINPHTLLAKYFADQLPVSQS